MIIFIYYSHKVKTMRCRFEDVTYILLTLLVMLAMVDVVTSSMILRMGGVELNRLMVHVAGSPFAFLTVKLLYLILILLMIVISRELHSAAPQAILLTGCGITLQAVIWNSWQLWVHL